MLCIIAAVVVVLAGAAGASGAELVPLRVGMHVDTSISHSCRTIKFAGIPIKTIEGEMPPCVEDTARMAREQGLDVLILADRARAEVSYGLTRYSRLFKLTVSEGSIASYGSDRYLKRAREAAEVAGITIIPGAECIPYYRWRGNPFSGLMLSHLYEHMVLAGLDTAEALDGIPRTAGGYGYRFSGSVLLNLVPIVLLGFGVRLWRHRPRRRRRKLTKLAGGLLAALSVLVLVDCAPFLPRRISAYDEPTIDPADVLGRYAEKCGALAFWAHPAANPGSRPHHLKQTTGIDVEVKPYPEVLCTTAHYTGFAMFNAGIRPGEPGQQWDRALRQYCAGERAQPVWVISECDFDTGHGVETLSEAQTVVWARDDSPDAVLDALRNGRCYATMTYACKRLRVENWRLTDGTATARSGETLTTSAPSVGLYLRLFATAPKKARRRMEVKAVVNGLDTHTFLPRLVSEGADGGALEAAGEVAIPSTKKKSYVRVIVYNGGDPILALNPIFVLRRPKGATGP